MPRIDSPVAGGVTLRMIKAMKAVIATHETVQTRKEFAEHIGTTNQFISRWSSGEANCTVENIAIACKKFRINPTYLILGQGEMFTAGANKESVKVGESILTMSKEKPVTKTRNSPGKRAPKH
jgi:transcriptional regulator with XRE-family HTH domain